MPQIHLKLESHRCVCRLSTAPCSSTLRWLSEEFLEEFYVLFAQPRLLMELPEYEDDDQGLEELLKDLQYLEVEVELQIKPDSRNQ
jgi:hypothetical protein